MILENLFTPLKIGSMELKNRIAMAPMSLGYESQDGTINEKMTDYWEARAKGGAGLIIVDVVTVDGKYPYLGNTTGLYNENQVSSFKNFVNKMHSYNAKVIPQISHPGPESISSFFGLQPVSSSSYSNSLGQTARELGIEEIDEIIEKYAETAKQARNANCDGVELHCAHAYMLAGAFLSPLRNKRTDMYGGSLDNRARFVIEIIKRIKEKAGEDFPIVMRISGDERVPGGNTLEDMLYLIPKFIRAGVDAFEVSGGTQYELCWKIIPCHSEANGVNIKEAEAIKKVSTVPVLVVGKINDARYAEHILESNFADGVVMGRALLADPELPNKAMNDSFDDIAPCVGCGIGCIGEQMARRPTSCIINPSLGKEKEMEIVLAKEKKNVLVIGGGIAGLEAARVAKLRGHSVTLVEKDNKLGGQINTASIPPFKQELTKWIVYLTNQIQKLGVKIELNKNVSIEDIKNMNPDAVIVATGAKSLIPPIKGIENEKVVVGVDVLNSKHTVLKGNILVIGGGMVGCELTETLFFNARGKINVTIVDMLDDIAMDVIPNNRIPMLQRLYSQGVKVYTKTSVKEITSDHVIIEVEGKEDVLAGFDHILLACGSKSQDDLSEKLKELVREVYVIGDASTPSNALHATKEATKISREI